MGQASAGSDSGKASQAGTEARPLRIGVVGLRNIGRRHVGSAASLPGVQVTAVADMDPQRVKQTQEEHGVASGYTDAKELFEKSDVDGVVLALPTNLHGPMSIAAMEAGRHVLVEKPVAGSTAEARQLIAVRDRTQRILAVGMNQRFRPQVAAAKELIASGKLGKVKFCRTRWTRPAFNTAMDDRGSWQFDRARGGGPLLDLGIHKLDLFMHILGFPKPLEVMGSYTTEAAKRHATRGNYPCSVEDYAMGMFRLDNGILLELTAGLADASSTEETQLSMIACELGGILQTKGSLSAYTYDPHGQIVPMDLPARESDATTPVEHFCRVLQGKEQLIPTAEEGLLGMEMLEALLQSADQNRTIQLA